jgi:imidazoleglycerol-phosphate dehydratase
VDDHHTVEDVGIAMGEALLKALGDKKGIARYADIRLPMDEALAEVAVDISGRPCLVFEASFAAPKIGAFDVELVREWFHAFAVNARITLHAEIRRGANGHHVAEALFKGLARALRSAVAIDAREEGRVPSTKGAL